MIKSRINCLEPPHDIHSHSMIQKYTRWNRCPEKSQAQDIEEEITSHLPVQFQKTWLTNLQEETNPKMSKFSLILASFVPLGNTLWPIWSPHLRATCAGDFPNLSAIILRIEFLRAWVLMVPGPGEPRGVYP
jgi:hypothetical protein